MSIKKDKLKREINAKQEINILENKIKKKEIQFKKLKQDSKKDKDKFLLNIADLQNLLKRNEKEFVKEKSNLKKKYLILIVDFLELIKKSYDDKNPKKGIKLIINNIEKLLLDENVKYIECIGESFDHRIHHAITTIEKKDCNDEIILDELKKGYYVNNEILRPSQVIVSKKKIK